jgi:tRNA(Leu) C34 or U34 (ribose-2'-O)-methylase TrmL
MAHNSKETNDTHFFGIGLHSPRNGFNIGAAIRACGNFGSSYLVASDTRYNVTDPRTGHRKSDFRNTDTEQMRKRMPCFIGVPDLFPFVPFGCETVVLERDDTATNLSDFVHPRRAFYIFGPEDGAVPSDIVNKCDHKVYIPSQGSMNLAHAITVTLYDRVAKSDSFNVSELICPKCQSPFCKLINEEVRHCNSCGHEGPHMDWVTD